KATFPVTGTQLHEIFPDTPQDRCDEVASIINKYSDDYGLTTPERMAHFIGQIGAETMLKNLDEKSYSASRILTADKTRTIRTHNGKKVLKYCSIFEGYSADGASCPYPYCDEDIVVPEGSYSGSYASTTFMQGMNKIVRANMVDELPRDPDFFNVVYACNDIGNGNINSGDGYRFRGRGFMQITGYSNYRKMVQAKWDEVHGRGTKDFMCRSETCDKNLDDIANDLDFSMLISLTFWKAGNTNDLANEVNKRAIQDVTIAVNGKEIGIDNRTLYTNKAYAVFKK
ncbi:glycoside hydrolase family 19 protein, partial [Pseudarcicella hirudinis]|uniref:glycoside hydrolase family 19 protein n=1 Tax=Pseudarcicella hirudinis TaxID=1079859 RepID=UPI00362EEE19